MLPGSEYILHTVPTKFLWLPSTLPIPATVHHNCPVSLVDDCPLFVLDGYLPQLFGQRGLASHASATASKCQSNTGLTQMVTYVKRHPNSTREEFWDYWQEQHAPKVVPLATHFNITRYQQIQVGGHIPPTNGGASEPSSEDLVEFDGIAMFLYESPEILADMLAHPYYVDVVEPDEHKFIDKNAFGGGMVATYIGMHVEAVDRARDVWVGDEKIREEYKEMFEGYV